MSNTCIAIQGQTDAAEARRAAMALADAISFDETAAGSVGLVVTEAARNLLKHAGGGNIILGRVGSDGEVGMEMLALDKGPGIADIQRCFQDGYSTAGTAGTGLGAIARLSSMHEIYTRSDQGTVLMAQWWKRGAAVRRPRFHVSGVSVALPGEQECGDGWIVQERAHGVRLVVVDGLGHGTLAADAARTAIGTAREHLNEPGPALMKRMHDALRATRGAAVAVAEIDARAQVVRFTGVGNISAVVVPASGPLRHLVSYAGTVGHNVRKMLELTYPWTSGALLLMHSDGLHTHWSLDRYPGLLERHPSLIAGVLYRDHVRGRDDVTVVIAREAASVA